MNEKQNKLVTVTFYESIHSTSELEWIKCPLFQVQWQDTDHKYNYTSQDQVNRSIKWIKRPCLLAKQLVYRLNKKKMNLKKNHGTGAWKQAPMENGSWKKHWKHACKKHGCGLLTALVTTKLFSVITLWRASISRSHLEVC